MSKYCAVENQSSAILRPGDRFHRITSRSASLYGSGRSSSALVTLNSAALAPMPMASDSMAARVKPGFAANPRIAYRRSLSTGYFAADAHSGTAANLTTPPSTCGAMASNSLAFRRPRSSGPSAAIAAFNGAARSVWICQYCSSDG